MGQKGRFKNVKLGKDVHRKLKRRGEPGHGRAKKATDGRRQGKR